MPVLGSEDCNVLKPLELTRDRTVLFRGGDGKTEFAVCFEVQLRKDESRRFAWPMYVVRLFHDLRCPVVLLVLTTDENVRTWCAAGFEVGHPGFVLYPLVVTPEHIDRITTVAEAAGNIELAVLSALTFGDEPGGVVVLDAVFAALATIDPDTAAQYSEIIAASLRGSGREHVEELVVIKDFQYTSRLAQRLRAEGKAEGAAEKQAEFVVMALQRRGVCVSAEERARILACADLETLDRWLDRAFTVEKAADVFDG